MSYFKLQDGAVYLAILASILLYPELSFSAETDEAVKKAAQPGVTTGSPIGPVLLLFIIAFSGAFGGFVDGLRTKASYIFSYKGKEINIGFIGDMLVGATASIVIFTVLDSVFKVDLVLEFEKTEAVKNFVKLVAWSVLSGFIGPQLLNKMSEKMILQLAGDAAREEINKNLEAEGDADIYVDRGDMVLSEYESKGGSNSVMATTLSPKDAKDMLNKAIKSYQLGLEGHPNHKQALIGKARAHRRLAEVAEFENDAAEKTLQWKNAISALDAIRIFNANSPKALYNLACYLYLTNPKDIKVQEYLEKAISLQPGLKSEAASDEDLKGLKGTSSWFGDLIN